MRLRHILGSSIILFIFNIVTYYSQLPEWVYPISILFFINSILIMHYHNDSQPSLPPIPTPLETGEKKQLKELEIAKRVQQALLEVSPPRIANVSIAKRCIPATTLGGDFYTFVSKSVQALSQKAKTPGIIEYRDTQENSLGIAIGDVAGHGVSSALVMALSFGLLGKIGQSTSSPAQILKRANEDIRKFITNSQISHVTAIYSILHPESRRFSYASAGHHPALLVKKSDNSVHELYSQGAFLGVYPDEEYEEHETHLEPGDRVVLFTDGIIEPANDNKELYGEDRLKRCLLANPSTDIQRLIDIILEDIQKFTNNSQLKDDQTIIILEVN